KGLEKVISMAKDRGGHDNITGILVEVVEGNPSIEEEAEEARKLEAELQPSDPATVPHFVGDEPTMPSKDDAGSAAPDASGPPPARGPAEESGGLRPSLSSTSTSPRRLASSARNDRERSRRRRRTCRRPSSPQRIRSTTPLVSRAPETTRRARRPATAGTSGSGVRRRV